jgi:hypothetical protein
MVKNLEWRSKKSARSAKNERKISTIEVGKEV